MDLHAHKRLLMEKLSFRQSLNRSFAFIAKGRAKLIEMFLNLLWSSNILEDEIFVCTVPCNDIATSKIPFLFLKILKSPFLFLKIVFLAMLA